MTAESTEIAKLEQVDFSIMDKADEEQIINASDDLKQALVYKVNNKFELSYVGLKHLALLMSQNGQSLEILDCKMELLGDKPEEKVWYATVKVRNQKTRYETIGMSECPYYYNGKYDPFGRTKALSKAERNAWRKQIPEFEIKKLLEDSQKKGLTKELEKNCSCMIGKQRKSPTTNKCLECGGRVA